MTNRRPWPWRTAWIVAATLAVAIGLAACGGTDNERTDGSTAASTSADTATAEAGGDAVAGESVFAANCAGCHGPDGKGGNGGPDLSQAASVADLTNVISQVTNGGGGMPAFGDQLTQQEIEDVATYVRDVVHGGQ